MVAARGQSLKRFAENVGIPYRSFQDYVAGKSRPGFEQLEKLSRGGLDIGYLLSGRPTTNFPSGFDHEFSSSMLLAADNEIKELVYHLLTGVSDRAINLMDQAAFLEQPTSAVMQTWERLVHHAVLASADLDKNLVDLRAKGVPALTAAEVVAEAAWSRYIADSK